MENIRQYRGKRKDTGEWIFGAFSYKCNSDKIKTGAFIISDYHWSEGIEVIPETVGIERGLPDKNGSMIFQGDIISINGFHKKIVGFDEHGFYLENVDDIKNRDWMDTRQRPNPVWWNDFKREIEIVGNIHDNPELMEHNDG